MHIKRQEKIENILEGLRAYSLLFNTVFSSKSFRKMEYSFHCCYVLLNIRSAGPSCDVICDMMQSQIVATSWTRNASQFSSKYERKKDFIGNTFQQWWDEILMVTKTFILNVRSFHFLCTSWSFAPWNCHPTKRRSSKVEILVVVVVVVVVVVAV